MKLMLKIRCYVQNAGISILQMLSQSIRKEREQFREVIPNQ